MRISDWSSDVCSSDLIALEQLHADAAFKFIEPTTDGRLRRSQRPPCRTERTVSRHGEHEFQVIPIHPEPQSHKRPHTISYSRSAETMCISDRKSTRLNSSH